MEIEGSKIVSDFDLIAYVDNCKWDNNTHFHKYLLKKLPEKINSSLDLGCGKGSFAELLGSRSGTVTGIDISPGMIEQAISKYVDASNIIFLCADINTYDIGAEKYDLIVSIAALHHMEPEIVIPKLITALKSNGTLLILDLFKNETLADYIFSIVSLPFNFMLNFFHNNRFLAPQKVRSAWKRHAATDKYLSINEIRLLAGKLLTGVVIKRHLLWRYSLVWKKQS